ncbi:unnamed protein product, partial [Mesorhabditis belari]|uniref:Uncharacterized protein n=1 Tax=Mesorhabditis belari TaxID=2138241 RepID=A0AAF3EYG2_9BILA
MFSQSYLIQPQHSFSIHLFYSVLSICSTMRTSTLLFLFGVIALMAISMAYPTVDEHSVTSDDHGTLAEEDADPNESHARARRWGGWGWRRPMWGGYGMGITWLWKAWLSCLPKNRAARWIVWWSVCLFIPTILLTHLVDGITVMKQTPYFKHFSVAVNQLIKRTTHRVLPHQKHRVQVFPTMGIPVSIKNYR